MPDLHVIQEDATDALAREALEGLGCVGCGIIVLRGATRWAEAADALPFRIAHDEREAPYAVDERGVELPDVKLSLSDEDDCLACFWARTAAGSPLLGVGVDLSSAGDFDDARPGARRVIPLLFAEREHELAKAICPQDASFAYATLFGAKEAAFKATAQPLRAWYQAHDEELSFEVRHFSMTDVGTERGEQRDGAAQRAMDLMGIGQVAVRHMRLGDMALVVATARSTDDTTEVAHGLS